MTLSKTSTIFNSALALMALTSAQAAQAQQAQKTCVEPQEVADTVVYVLPTAFDAALMKCGDAISPDSFMRSEAGDAFIEKFRNQQDQRWPGTYGFIKTFITAQADKGDSGTSQMIASLPEESLRPFVDGILGSIIAEELKPEMCAKANRVVELISPLPPENVGGLLSFIVEEVDLKDPDICKSDGSFTASSEEEVATQ